jgi:pimeloyl-ACP methyl ester carboxylesterase
VLSLHNGPSGARIFSYSGREAVISLLIQLSSYDLQSDGVLRYNILMKEFMEIVFAWVGENESVLSGMVAIAVLIGLLATGVRWFTLRSKTDLKTALEIPVAAPKAEATLDQEIRYCCTSDGVRIAYAVSGEGSPIVRSLGWYTHLEVEWSSPLGRSFWQRLSRDHQLIRYDGRGIGLSESTTDFSAENRLKDLEAVVDAAGLDQFALLGASEGSRTALRYVAKHPERVSHLILYGSFVNNAEKKDLDQIKLGKMYMSMVEAGWEKESHRKMFADLFLGLSASTEETNYFMEMQRSSASQEVATAYIRSLDEREQGFEVAGQIRAPTLILHPKDDQIVPFQNSLDLAAEIPGARLKPLDGDCHWLLLKSARSEEYINAIEAFLRGE